MRKVLILPVFFLSLLFAFVTITVSAQWVLQNNPLGSGENAMLGKVQFVSATEGWIAAGSNGSLLHTVNGGKDWSIVTPFSGEQSFSMSDPAINMSWSSVSNGAILKTYGSDFDHSNGMVLYSTNNSGSSWSKKIFPKSITTVSYSLSDLQGTWQMHEIVVGNSSSENKFYGWIHGVATFNSGGVGNVTGLYVNGMSQPDMNNVGMEIASNGVISVPGATQMHGFMSADKRTITITSPEAEGTGWGLMVLQKQITGVTYSLSDLQGDWEVHVLSVGDSTGKYAGWGHAAMTANALGGFTGTFVGPDNNSNSIGFTASISASGIVSGLSNDAHGFMSADKKSIFLTFKGDEQTGNNKDYNLVVFQKRTPAQTYSIADVNGRWQMHGLVSGNTNNYNYWTAMQRGAVSIYPNGDAQLKGFMINENSISGSNAHFSISDAGIISGTAADVHGFLSSDKSLMIQTSSDGSGGYSLHILQRDVSVSDDFGLQTQFVNTQNGWASGFNMLYGIYSFYRTTDGGANWNPVNTNMGGIYHFIDVNTGWMIGANASVIGEGNLTGIYKTTNGGVTWTQQYYDASQTLNAIHFTDNLHGWVVGKQGLVLKTVDGGVNWLPVTNTGMSTNNNSKSVFFLNATTGWLAYNTEYTEGVGTQIVLATTDGGATWQRQSTPVTNSIFSINFWNADNGWLVSDYGQIANYYLKKLVLTPGGLSAALTEAEKNDISSLQISGSIDARDFRIMRDSMPALAYIDLSGCTIAAYTGTAGTNGNTSLTYPANTIPSRAFYNPTTLAGKPTLATFIFPAGVTAVGTYAFRASGLTDVQLPSTVTAVGYGNFLYCNNLRNISLPSTISYIDKWAFGYCTALEQIDFPTSLTTIGDAAFLGSGIRQLNFPGSMVSIGKWAFQSCSNLQNVSLPLSLTSLGAYAFTFDNALQSFNVPAEHTLFSSWDGVLYDKLRKKLLVYPGGRGSVYQIPDGVNVIDTAAFEGCSNVYEVMVPTSVHTISLEAFYWCTSLQTITIPASVSTIGAYAFYNCYNMYSIHANAFHPVGLHYADSVFNYVNKDYFTLYVPTGSKSLYDTAFQWKDFAHIVEETPQTVSLSVKVPSGTHACYVAGNFSGWNIVPMNKVDSFHYTIALNTSDPGEYKYLSGPAWAFGEKDILGNDISNRMYKATDTVVRWGIVFDPLLYTTKVFTVKVPAGTNACYIAGDLNNWNFSKMYKIDETHYTFTTATYPGFTHKYCSGLGWNYVEVDAGGNDIPNRTYKLLDTVIKWKAVAIPEPLNVAIIQNFSDFEINTMQSYLDTMGIASHVFNKEEVNFDVLKYYDMVIWDDLGYQSGGIYNDVAAVIWQYYNTGKPVYFIGDDLSYSAGNLSEDWATKWISMLHLVRADNFSYSQHVAITNENHPITNGPYGKVGEFDYYEDIDNATRTNTGEEVLASSYQVDVVLAYSASNAKSVTQNCMLYNAGNQESIEERKKLFRNAVWWLFGKKGFDSYWLGTVSNEWENPANWSTGHVPSVTTNVYVNAVTPFSPVINSVVYCQSLHVLNGVTVTVNAGKQLILTGH